MSLTFLVGGASSGKSSLAVRMAKKWDGPVSVIATGQPMDEEMAEKIARHRALRPPHWETIEEPLDLEGAVLQATADYFVIVDCLTLWLSNLMGEDLSDEEIEARSNAAASFARDRDGPTIVISNEVGSGIVPANELARRYRNLLGLMNSQWADIAVASLLVVAGRAIPLASPEEFLEKGQ